ncbi:hypothetical protein AeMF1_019615 [Aphanomyces euteiches]|nr:hypothetical protein AeMF1_019615 [Aphanomyces euteiches]KAH9184246.1 hypothetical protein AeNC1_013777 [Aphanomyces euteiches]
MAVDAVIFDLDGTLLDTEKISMEAFVQVLGPQFTMEHQRRVMGVPLDTWPLMLIADFQLTMTPTDLAHQVHAAYEEKLPFCTLIPGGLNLVTGLTAKGIKVALATSSTASAVSIKRMAHPALFDAFDVIVCGDDPAVKRGKPNPDIFLTAAARLGIQDMSQCVVVEDSVSGVQGGKAAGMQVVAVPDTRFFDADDIAKRFSHADVILSSLHDFQKAVFP